jgi:hypothetical protein
VTSAIVGARAVEQLAGNLEAADLRLDPHATAIHDAASDPRPGPSPDGPVGAAQRDRTTNGPEALRRLVQQFAASQ